MVSVTVLAIKPTRDTKTGIGLTTFTDGTVRITSIPDNSMFANTDLKCGMTVETINGVNIATSKEAVTLMKEAEDQVVIVASFLLLKHHRRNALRLHLPTPYPMISNHNHRNPGLRPVTPHEQVEKPSLQWYAESLASFSLASSSVPLQFALEHRRKTISKKRICFE